MAVAMWVATPSTLLKIQVLKDVYRCFTKRMVPGSTPGPSRLKLQ